MDKTRANIKILLLQVRQDQDTILEELYGFIESSKLSPQQITCINPLQQTHIDWQAYCHYDAVFVGGSSDVSVLEPVKYPFIKHCKQLMIDCYQQKVPVFASCFGFQLAIEALGGQVILDTANKEIGLFQIQCHTNAKEDILLHDTPDKFWAVSGHKERAYSLPPNTTQLNYTERCPYHGFKFNDRPFYAFQYHPEMSDKDLHARIQRYQKRYAVADAELAELLRTAHQDTQEANKLIEKFIDRILLSH